MPNCLAYSAFNRCQPAELHSFGADDASDGSSAQKVIQNIETNVPPGSTHCDEAATDVGPQSQARAATNGFELPPHIEATPLVLKQPWERRLASRLFR